MATLPVSELALTVKRRTVDRDTFVVTSLGDSCAALAATSSLSLPLDAMGVALGVGIGIVATTPVRVLVVETDGSVLMDLSALATFAEVHERVPDLRVLVIDNGMYHSAGQIPRPCAALDWKGLVESFGLTCAVVDEIDPDTALLKPFDKWPDVIVCKVDAPEEVPPIPLDGRSRVVAARWRLEELGLVHYQPPSTKN